MSLIPFWQLQAIGTENPTKPDVANAVAAATEKVSVRAQVTSAMGLLKKTFSVMALN